MGRLGRQISLEEWISEQQPVEGPDIPECVEVFDIRPLYRSVHPHYLRWLGASDESLEVTIDQPGPAEDPTSRESADTPPIPSTRQDPRTLSYFRPEFYQIIARAVPALARYALGIPTLVGAGDHIESIGDYNVARPVGNVAPPHGDKHCDSALVGLCALRAFTNCNTTVTRIASKEGAGIDDQDPRTYHDLHLPPGYVAFGDFMQREHYAWHGDFDPTADDPDNCRVTFATNLWKNPEDFDPEQRRKHNYLLGYRDETLVPEVRNYYCLESLKAAAEHRTVQIEESGDVIGHNAAFARQVLETLPDIPEFEDIRYTARYLLDFVASVKL